MADDKEEKKAAKAKEKADKAKAKEDKKAEAKAAKAAKEQAKKDAKSAKAKEKEDKKKAKKDKKKKKKGGGDDDEEEDEDASKRADAEDGEELGDDEDADADAAEDAPGDGGAADEEDEDDDGLDANVATAEELEEERQDEAVRVLQNLYRRRKGRKLLKEMVRANFVKEYDQESGEFVYKNVRTGQIQYLKPAALGAEDLPHPPVYFAPKGYMAEPSETRQFACVITCSRYITPKLEDLAPHYMQDHEELRGAIIHPYLAKYKDEDCVFMKDPSKSGVLANFDVSTRRAHARARSPRRAQ